MGNLISRSVLLRQHLNNHVQIKYKLNLIHNKLQLRDCMLVHEVFLIFCYHGTRYKNGHPP